MTKKKSDTKVNGAKQVIKLSLLKKLLTRKNDKRNIPESKLSNTINL